MHCVSARIRTNSTCISTCDLDKKAASRTRGGLFGFLRQRRALTEAGASCPRNLASLRDAYPTTAF